ncbi:MAG: hypothetical protein H0X62_08395 [Bacteroidetes bacterium]|nr:hypothetical protein [Bacteroidota bacterium]
MALRNTSYRFRLMLKIFSVKTVKLMQLKVQNHEVAHIGFTINIDGQPEFVNNLYRRSKYF